MAFDEGDPDFNRYLKMFRMGVPRESLEQEMQIRGMTIDEVDEAMNTLERITRFVRGT